MTHFKSTFTTGFIKRFSMLFANDARSPFTILARLPWSLRPSPAFCVRCTYRFHDFAHSKIFMRNIRRNLREHDYRSCLQKEHALGFWPRLPVSCADRISPGCRAVPLTACDPVEKWTHTVMVKIVGVERPFKPAPPLIQRWLVVHSLACGSLKNQNWNRLGRLSTSCVLAAHNGAS